MSEHECAAAVTVKTKFIHDLLRVFALSAALRVVLPEVSYWLAAGEASDWDDHALENSRVIYKANG